MKKILIIEDDQSIAELERDYLEMNNFSVIIEQREIWALTWLSRGFQSYSTGSYAPKDKWF